MIRRGDLPQRAAFGCAALAVVAVGAGLVLARPVAGLAVATGLVVGASNGWLARRALGAQVDFRLAGLVRISVLTAAGLGLAALLGLDTLPLVMGGIGLAQLVLASLAAIATVGAVRA